MIKYKYRTVFEQVVEPEFRAKLSLEDMRLIAGARAQTHGQTLTSLQYLGPVEVEDEDEVQTQ